LNSLDRALPAICTDGIEVGLAGRLFFCEFQLEAEFNARGRRHKLQQALKVSRSIVFDLLMRT